MIQNTDELRKSLFSLTNKGIKYDLERIRHAAEETRNLDCRFASVHVAGTNGKGSTCAYIESVLRCAGYKTGLFTSPHLIRFEERFRINCKEIEEAMWVGAYERLMPVIEKNQLTFFEVTMLLALELFKEEDVEWAIFETGMGGRLDATNIIRPEVTVITSIAMDHREYLGETIEKVATEKLGIVKKGIPLVAVEPEKCTVRDLIISASGERDAPLTFLSRKCAEILSETAIETVFRYRDNTYTIGMKGSFQVLNALLAIESIRKLGISIPDENVAQGLKIMRLEGRFERKTVGRKEVVIDVAHNPDAINELCCTLRNTFLTQPIVIVAGIMADKDYCEMLQILNAVASHIILTCPAIARAARTEQLSACLTDRFTVTKSVESAVIHAFSREEPVLCITGSFYTAGEAIAALGGLWS